MSTNIQLRVVVDRGSCCGYGLCAAICPEIYKLDDGGPVSYTHLTLPTKA